MSGVTVQERSHRSRTESLVTNLPGATAHHNIHFEIICVPDQIGTPSQVGTKKISKGGWTI